MINLFWSLNNQTIKNKTKCLKRQIKSMKKYFSSRSQVRLNKCNNLLMTQSFCTLKCTAKVISFHLNLMLDFQQLDVRISRHFDVYKNGGYTNLNKCGLIPIKLLSLINCKFFVPQQKSKTTANPFQSQHLTSKF